MPRIAYVNGRYVPHAEAAVHIEDRGLQFADGVYEVVAIVAGRLVDEDGHYARLGRSLGELRIAWPVAEPVLRRIVREVVARNHLTDGIVYMQVTRGVAKRDHAFPAGVRPGLIVTGRAVDRAAITRRAEEGIAVRTVPDLRWARRDIKATALLPNVLAKQAAREAGAYEAWLVDAEGFVTEGSSTNAWIVTPDGCLVTRPRTHDILWGVTRATVLETAASLQMRVEERAFTVAEAQAAAEAFITAATVQVMPVIAIDGVAIGSGRPGPAARALRAAYPLDGSR